MLKFKIAIFAILGVVLVPIFSVEVFVATILSFTVTGNVGYYTTEIGAKVWETHAYNEDGVFGQVSYCDFSGATSLSDYIFNNKNMLELNRYCENMFKNGELMCDIAKFYSDQKTKYKKAQNAESVA